MVWSWWEKRDAARNPRIEDDYELADTLRSIEEDLRELAAPGPDDGDPAERLADQLLVEAGMPKKKRPGDDPMKWGLDNLISVGAEAGWLEGRDDEDIEFPLRAWAQTLRLIRNLLHPGRHALEHPHVVVGDTQIDDARSIYTVVCEVLDAKGQRNDLGSSRRARRSARKV